MNPITTSELSVTIKTISIGKNKLTSSFIKQLPRKENFLYCNGEILHNLKFDPNFTPWGYVTIPDKTSPDYLLASNNGILYKSEFIHFDRFVILFSVEDLTGTEESLRPFDPQHYLLLLKDIEDLANFRKNTDFRTLENFEPKSPYAKKEIKKRYINTSDIKDEVAFLKIINRLENLVEYAKYRSDSVNMVERKIEEYHQVFRDAGQIFI